MNATQPEPGRAALPWYQPVGSECEVFSHAFQTLERGVLVGVPTFGGVISTGGTSGRWASM